MAAFCPERAAFISTSSRDRRGGKKEKKKQKRIIEKMRTEEDTIFNFVAVLRQNFSQQRKVREVHNLRCLVFQKKINAIIYRCVGILSKEPTLEQGCFFPKEGKDK